MKRWQGLLLVALTAGCGNAGQNPAGPAPDGASFAIHEGDGQTMRVGEAVVVPPAVIVRDEEGRPLEDVRVTFAVQSGGGSVEGETEVTGEDGIARVKAWVLGGTPGPNVLVASAEGVAPVEFSATARYPHWTFMVYLAADNSLAAAGVFDIEEMETAGTHPEVQVVTQAEFSPVHLANAGCGDPSCINRPNFNTFRYAVEVEESTLPGPDGPVEDIGNRDMTDPAQLAEFVQWAKENHPAERYALVLWNHGGGYVGLIQDLRSSGNDLMSIGDLRAGLSGVGPIDVLDFDMCLMGGYETLLSVQGLADFVVFSEEVVPGEGNPYREIIDAIQADPSLDGRSVASLFVDQFHAAFANGDQGWSTTKSAYDMTRLAEFDGAIGALADALRNELGTLRPVIQTATLGSQKFSYRQLTDVVDFLDQLESGVSDTNVRSLIDTARSAAEGAFRVNNKARSGGQTGLTNAPDVSRAHGLHILLPSGTAVDALPANGPGSFASWQTLYGETAWGAFLEDWLAPYTSVILFDQGNEAFEDYVVWEPAAVEQDVDIDFWVLEPNGNIYVPFLGIVTPNGVLTIDSREAGTPYEGYLTNRFIEVGVYFFFVHLFDDPNDFRPFYDIVFRRGATADFESLYDPDLPQLSLDNSFILDPTPSVEEILDGTYTDLNLAAFLEVGQEASSGIRPAEAYRGGLRASSLPARPEITAEQWRTLSELREGRSAARGAGLQVPAELRRMLQAMPPR